MVYCLLNYNIVFDECFQEIMQSAIYYTIPNFYQSVDYGEIGVKFKLEDTSTSQRCKGLLKHKQTLKKIKLVIIISVL